MEANIGPQAMTRWDQQVDLLVFGSGAAGMTAALVGAHEGLDVVLCEKSPLVGGTTATSGGSLWIPGAGPIVRNGKAESVEEVRRYLRGELDEHVRWDLMDAFLAAGPAAIDYLEQRTDVRFEHLQNPDYHSDSPGGSAFGRAITAAPFDGRLLGPDFELLRPPRSVFLIFGGMMVYRREIQTLLRPFASLSALKHAIKVLALHAWSRLRYPRGTRLLIGNALIGRYLLSLRKKGVPIWVNANLVELVREGAQVSGAVVEVNGVRRAVRARRGTVLATGGIPHNKALRAELMKRFPHSHSLVFEGNTGDGLVRSRAVGAVVDDGVSNPGFWSPASILKRPDGGETVWVHGHMDRGKPGLIAVNSEGRRFVNEADSYHDFVMAMFRSTQDVPAIPAYLICDHRFIRRYGLGLVRPLYPRLAPYVAAGYLKTAQSVADLARQLGIDPANLAETIAEHNRDADSGVDRAFGRGSTAFNRFNGDPENKPNPCMKPIENPPYYAMAVHPCTIGTTIGIKTDKDARALDSNANPIRGLYACGNDASSVMRGFYPGPGITLGPAVVFAYRAVMHMVSKTPAGSSIH